MSTTQLSHREVFFGELRLLCTEEEQAITPEQAQEMERVLNSVWLPEAMADYGSDYKPNFAISKLGVPSLLVRIDMPPMLDARFPGLYEVEANPAGLGAAKLLGVPVHQPVAEALKAIGISRLAFRSLESRDAQREEHVAAMRGLAEHGIEIDEWDGKSQPESLLWLRAGHEDIEGLSGVLEKCVLLHHHAGGHKKYLLRTSNAVMLRDCRAPFADPRFQRGFVLKPWGGWGSRGVHVYSSELPWKRSGATVTQMARAIDGIFERGEEGQYLVQPFLPPQPFGEGYFRNWRVFAVWTPQGYKVIGGFWNARNSLKLHGAGDTVWGPIRVSS